MKKIVIDCERNDIVDIKCGGPEYLGFDFFVEDENIDEMILFIKEELKKNNLPLISINYYDTNNTKIWTKEQISECIKEGY